MVSPLSLRDKRGRPFMIGLPCIYILYVYIYMSTVLSDSHPRRTLHGVRMSGTTAVRTLRPCTSRTHPQLCATGADLLRNPGPLSPVSALQTPLKYRNIEPRTALTQQVEILGDPVDPFRIVDIPFAIHRVHLPPSSMHTND